MNDPKECFAYAEHLQREHHRFNQLLGQIGHEVAQLAGQGEQQATIARLGKRLTDLHHELQSHYAEEEAGGCLEEAVTRCPSLAKDSKSILEEHPQLNRMLAHLIAQTTDPAVKPTELQQEWQAFYSKIQIHEAAETRLLQMAFGADAADYDVEGTE